ncbi:MAG: EAL domain-containing protein [Desulfuromonadaceae bacterium]
MSDQSENRSTRLINRLAGATACLIAIVPALAYLLGDYQQLHGALEADARTQAAIVSQIVNRNPGVWQFAHERLKSGLEEVRDVQRRTRIIDAKGILIAEFPTSLYWPVLVREAVFFDFGAPAGVVRVEASFRDGLEHAFIIVLVSSLVGGLLYRPMRRIPLDALRRANEALVSSEERNRTVVNGLREGVLLADANSRVLATNPAAARILGVPEAELVGADLTKLLDGLVVGSDAVPMDVALWPVSQALASGESQDDIQLGLQRTGKPIQWLQMHAHVIVSGEGNPRFVVASFEDETESVHARERLLLTDRAFQSTSDAIFIADASERLVYVNQAFSTITGYPVEESIGRDMWELSGASLDEAGCREMAAALARDGAWRGQFWSRRKDRQAFAAWLNISLVNDAAGHPNHVVGSFSDVTERVLNEEHIRKLAQHDSLTGLQNRAMLRENMARVLAGARRRGGRVGVLFIDLDHFKMVNDTMGHAVGDQVLIVVAQRLTLTMREDDLVSRLAGDEFVVVIPDRSETDDVVLVADKLIKRLSEPYVMEGREFLLTPSIGISMFPVDGDAVDDLLSNADTAMYSAKNNGRANFQFFSSAMNSGTSARLELTNAVRLGLARKEFELYYQPQVEVGTGRLCGLEALIRWNHPQRGIVSPGVFIPVIEGSRLIIDIGEWVLGEAARQASVWRQRNLETVPIAVNISPLHFRQDNFVAQLSACIGSEGMRPGSLEIEITESLMINNADDTRLKMYTLKEMGFTLSLDDFGTGYSSLAYLTRYPFDKLKIDQSFVRRITVDKTALAIVEAIITLAHAVRLDVLAEGVETAEEAALLREKGCDQYQGYLVARPMPAAGVEAWLQGRGSTS